jgi:hypothetical protein
MIGRVFFAARHRLTISTDCCLAEHANGGFLIKQGFRFSSHREHGRFTML